jgi:large subunit ribosomal protein L14e
LVDGPTTGVKRQAISFKRATLTPLVLEGIPRGVGSASLTKLVEAQDIAGKFAQTAWAKKVSQFTRNCHVYHIIEDILIYAQYHFASETLFMR